MHKRFEVTFKVHNAHVGEITVQVRHAYDEKHAERVARGLIKSLTILEVISIKELVNEYY